MLSVPQRYLAVVALALGMTGPVSAQGTNERPGATAQPYLPDLAPKDSPFLPAPFQLTGVRLAGDGTRICIYAEKDKQSRWIAVGTSTGGIKAVSYDPEQHRAVISADGVTRELSLQQGVATAQTEDALPGASASATPAGAPSAPAPGTSTTETPAQRDARMLVSDLLDISIQQRQAYTNAQKAPAAPAAANK